MTAPGRPPSRQVVDLFAGPGGWDEGARKLGLVTVGVEWDDAACRTAMAAGHARVRADVETLPTEPMVGKVWGLIASPPCQDFSLAGKQAGITGEKGRLITQVLRWTNDLRPRWVACEQVPPCLPVWEEYAEVMRGWGYRTWTGVLNAADYGVPQTRKRAILLASLDRQPERPETTHARGGDVDLFSVRAPWISMATALGWTGEQTVRDSFGEPTDDYEGRAASRWKPATEPGPAVTTKTGSWVVRTGNNSMVTGRTGSRAGDGDVQPYERSVSEPAPTLDCAVGAKWTLTRPSTTIVGSFRPDIVAAPGWRTSDDGPRQNAPGSVKVSVQEAGILQSFPRDYPWQGSKTKQFQQVGNAIPPLLAVHVLAAATGLALPAQERGGMSPCGICGDLAVLKRVDGMRLCPSCVRGLVLLAQSTAEDGATDHCGCCGHRRATGCGGKSCPCASSQPDVSYAPVTETEQSAPRREDQS